MSLRALICALILVVAADSLAAQNIVREHTRIPRGAKVFVQKMDGFEDYLLAAFTKKKTPVLAVEDIEQADFVIEGRMEQQNRHWAEELFLAKGDVDRAAIRVTNRQTGTVAFTYVVEKDTPWKKGQSAAEACAKHLKDYIEKGK